MTILLVLCLGADMSRGQSTQWWPEMDVSIDFKTANLFVPSLLRLDSNLPNPQFAATGAIATVRLHRFLSVSAGYLFADLPQVDKKAHVPLAAVTSAFAVRHWNFSDVNRVERLLAYSNQPYRYRNRATADYSFGRRNAMHLYASNESFLNLSAGGEWNQNRAQVGLGVMLNRRLRFDTYYLQKSAPGGAQTPVVGTVIGILVNRRRPP